MADQAPLLPSERRRREEEARRRAIERGSIPYDPRKMKPRTSWGCLLLCSAVVVVAFYVIGRAILRSMGVF